MLLFFVHACTYGGGAFEGSRSLQELQCVRVSGAHILGVPQSTVHVFGGHGAVLAVGLLPCKADCFVSVSTEHLSV